MVVSKEGVLLASHAKHWMLVAGSTKAGTSLACIGSFDSLNCFGGARLTPKWGRFAEHWVIFAELSGTESGLTYTHIDEHRIVWNVEELVNKLLSK